MNIAMEQIGAEGNVIMLMPKKIHLMNVILNVYIIMDQKIVKHLNHSGKMMITSQGIGGKMEIKN
jgi:hypothetical protein